jgi:hypothetical protein
MDLSRLRWFDYMNGALNYCFVFLAWSALYFGIKHYQDLQAQVYLRSRKEPLAMSRRCAARLKEKTR